MAHYTPLTNCKQNVNKMYSSLYDYRKCQKDKTIELVLALFLNRTPVYFRTVSEG